MRAAPVARQNLPKFLTESPQRSKWSKRARKRLTQRSKATERSTGLLDDLVDTRKKVLSVTTPSDCSLLAGGVEAVGPAGFEGDVGLQIPLGSATSAGWVARATKRSIAVLTRAPVTALFDTRGTFGRGGDALAHFIRRRLACGWIGGDEAVGLA
jgi:hypothetical protein